MTRAGAYQMAHGVEDEKFRRTVTCANGHSFTTATASTWDGLYCPNNEEGWQCLKPLIDSAQHLVDDLVALRDELA